jgi:CRISPR-associated protein Cas2
MYDNNDSILIVPLSEDYARAMKIIGQDVDIDLILHSKNTLFF